MNMTSVIFKGSDGGDLFHPYCPPTPPSQGSPFNQLAVSAICTYIFQLAWAPDSLDDHTDVLHW